MIHYRQIQTGMAMGIALPILLIALAAWGQTPQASKSPTPTRSSASRPSASDSTLFEAKVRPLLLTSCVGCHGKDSAQGNLRLDAPISPGQAQEVVRRVKGEGGKPRMPLGAALPADKIAALETWVRSGARWPTSTTLSAPSLVEKGKTHWAFQPLARPHVPTIKNVSNAAWVRNPIDVFIAQRLEAAGLKPAPAATRRELIRRVTYDLIGLPPTPEEVSIFENDKSPNAWEKVVDRLLTSPHYGEKWGRHWLDLVRYAETNSYERDNPKPYITKYRDYVIRAFNEDKPYDRFVREQIAGDELPDANGDALAATAYYRLGIWDDEPADMKQAQYDDLDDLVATTGQAFLGLTLDCARCHDHKLDPIPQKDYYRFLAIFHNINRFKNGGPTDEALYFPTSVKKQEYERSVMELAAKRKANQAAIAATETAWREQRKRIENPNDLSDLHYRYFQGAYAGFPDFDKLKPVSSGVLSPAFIALRPRKREENFGFVFEGTLNVPQNGEYTFYLDSDDGSRISLAGKKTLEKTSAGGQGQEQHTTVHLNAGAVPFRLEYLQGGGPFGISVAWSGPTFARRPLSTAESCNAMGLPTLLAAELPILFTQERADQYTQFVKTKAELDKQEPTADKVLTVSEAGTKAPDTFVLLRGNVNTPGDKVDAGFPICAGGGSATLAAPLPDAKSTGRRLALANWLTSPQNPLTARVIVNRIWQHHFGRGLVRTPNDFGLQGAAPTHPELLNWLASNFIAEEEKEKRRRGEEERKQTSSFIPYPSSFACGWSFKKLHKLILMSNAYKQSSRVNPTALARDPQNDLFWRFDMRRLTAEEIRDSLLAVAGNLNPTLYGDSVYPEIPKEILAGQSIPGADWYTARMKPEDLNRRSIYIHVKRSLIYPMLANFDLPETDRTTPARFASTQPTQALGMLNGPFVNKQASVLANRVRHEVGPAPRAFTVRLLTLVQQRPPTNAETTEGMSLLTRLQGRGAKPEQAQTLLCLMALNLDEFVYLD